MPRRDLNPEDQAIAEVIARAMYQVQLPRLLRGVTSNSIEMQDKLYRTLYRDAQEAMILIRTDRRFSLPKESELAPRKLTEKQRAHLERLQSRSAELRAEGKHKRQRKFDQMTPEEQQRIIKMQQARAQKDLERAESKLELRKRRLALLDEGVLPGRQPKASTGGSAESKDLPTKQNMLRTVHGIESAETNGE